MRALVTEEVLPGPHDTLALIPPVTAVYVRRAPGLALWVWYTATDAFLVLHALTDRAP